MFTSADDVYQNHPDSNAPMKCNNDSDNFSLDPFITDKPIGYYNTMLGDDLSSLYNDDYVHLIDDDSILSSPITLNSEFFGENLPMIGNFSAFEGFINENRRYEDEKRENFAVQKPTEIKDNARRRSKVAKVMMPFVSVSATELTVKCLQDIMGKKTNNSLNIDNNSVLYLY